MTLKDALRRQATVRGGEDNGGHGTDSRDIEDGDGKGGSGSPGH
ncbi:hypothetical protein [Streptomyces sp. enrichment culture]